eukprot:840930-Rhodomonas_salina.2
MKAGHEVLLKVGSPQDPKDGCCVYLTDGNTICLRFVGDVWRLPLATASDTQSASTMLDTGTIDNMQ